MNAHTNPAGTTATTAGPTAISPAGALLGESPLWDKANGVLLWVDLWGGRLHATDPRAATTSTIELAPPLSSVALTEHGTLVLTSGLCVYEKTEDGTRHLADVPDSPCLRINDTAVDPAGRLWLGTMPLPHRPGMTGALWRLDPGADVPVRMLGDVALANGIAWSPAADRMYFVDSLRQTITVFPYDVRDGSLGPGDPFVRVALEDGMPDGIAVDADGGVWVALAGGGAVACYSPTGELRERITLPVRYPTSCAFGGDRLCDLFVTSGCRPENPDRRTAAIARGAGSLFRLTPGGRGLPANRMVI
ncbi:SMP-30/gluconolactonase/LRE family protein [Streptomyces sp. MK5]|uniref:SMP-30/gluconolactonase/LRE family protein n=1 Tax=Streptomyces sp. MK5 TaxID=3064253 RepID=UPI002740F89C|nr:SMP-30/gluconolactonase/LRE family protein [Streptomyces sp. MK5]